MQRQTLHTHTEHDHELHKKYSLNTTFIGVSIHRIYPYTVYFSVTVHVTNHHISMFCLLVAKPPSEINRINMVALKPIIEG